MKLKKREAGGKLHLAKETIRQLISDDLKVVAGGGCPSRAGCSSDTGESLNECGSLYCSMIQY